MFMPELSTAFAAYVVHVKYKTFVEHGLIPFGDEGFEFLLAIAVIDVSRNCRTRVGHRRIVETAIRRLVSENVASFVEHRKQHHGLRLWYHHAQASVGMSEDDKLVRDLIELFGRSEALRYYVEHWLFEHARELFGERHTVADAEGSKIIEHPMRTFTAFLNELEYLKAADPSAYRCEAERFQRVVALRRAGLAVLPPETRRQRVVLADGTRPPAEWERTAARAVSWPRQWKRPSGPYGAATAMRRA
jgi:hypothetical protein